MTDREALTVIRAKYAAIGKLLDTLSAGNPVRTDHLLEAARELQCAAQTIHSRAIGEPEPKNG